MNILENFSALFVEVWNKGILGIDIFQILIGLGIFFSKNSSSPGLKTNTFFHLICFNTDNTFSLIHIRLD